MKQQKFERHNFTYAESNEVFYTKGDDVYASFYTLKTVGAKALTKEALGYEGDIYISGITNLSELIEFTTIIEKYGFLEVECITGGYIKLYITPDIDNEYNEDGIYI